MLLLKRWGLSNDGNVSYIYLRIVRGVHHIKSNIDSVLNILERFDVLFSNILEWNQIEDLQLEMSEMDLSMSDMPTLNLLGL